MTDITRVTLCDKGETVVFYRQEKSHLYETATNSRERLWLLLGRLWDTGFTEPRARVVGSVFMTTFKIESEAADD